MANYPEEYIDQVLKRLIDVNDWVEFEDGPYQECASGNCDGTCDTCSAASEEQLHYEAYMELLSASKHETNFSADEIPF